MEEKTSVSAEDSKAEDSKAEDSKAEDSKAEDSKAKAPGEPAPVPYHQIFPSEWRPAAGALVALRGIVGPRVQDRRDVYVLTPPSYAQSDRRYPVVYMHDGQNLFDPAQSYAGSWHADKALAQLAGRGVEAIVVGVPNMGLERINEYGPFYDGRYRNGGRGSDYVGFVADTVKPLIDRMFRTRTEREATGLVGSSMGGLISLYGLFARPDVFSFAGVLSPSLHFAGWEIFRWLRGVNVRSSATRVFLSMGTKERGGRFAPWRWLRSRMAIFETHRARRLLVRKGMAAEAVQCRIVPGAGHHESQWAALLPEALDFLLPRVEQ